MILTAPRDLTRGLRGATILKTDMHSAAYLCKGRLAAAFYVRRIFICSSAGKIRQKVTLIGKKEFSVKESRGQPKTGALKQAIEK